jgi:cytochrome bd-type quinol oxidase subunit 2
MDRNLDTHQALHRLVHDIAARATVAVGLAAIGVIHLLDSIGKYSESRYLFWMYIALIVGCIAVGGLVLFTRARSAFLAAAALGAGALVGYVLSRTTGLPNASDDIGNWTEPLGLASMFVEAGVVAVALVAFVRTRGVEAAVPAKTESRMSRGTALPA